MDACAGGAQSVATLVVVGQHFSFAPTDGAVVLSGDVADNGRFATSPPPPRRESSRRNPATGPSLPQRVEGQLSEELATGTYQSPQCAVPFRLPRIPTRVLP